MKLIIETANGNVCWSAGEEGSQRFGSLPFFSTVIFPYIPPFFPPCIFHSFPLLLHTLHSFTSSSSSTNSFLSSPCFSPVSSSFTTPCFPSLPPPSFCSLILPLYVSFCSPFSSSLLPSFLPYCLLSFPLFLLYFLIFFPSFSFPSLPSPFLHCSFPLFSFVFLIPSVIHYLLVSFCNFSFTSQTSFSFSFTNASFPS